MVSAFPQPLQLRDDLSVEVRLAEAQHDELHWPDCMLYPSLSAGPDYQLIESPQTLGNGLSAPVRWKPVSGSGDIHPPLRMMSRVAR